MLSAIRTLPNYFDVGMLLARARELQPGVGRMTVYRVLADMNAAQLLHAIVSGDGSHRYCLHDPDAPTAEIIVQGGAVVRIPAPVLAPCIESLVKQAGYELTGFHLKAFARPAIA